VCFQQIPEAGFVTPQLGVIWRSTQPLVENLKHNSRISYVGIIDPVGIYFSYRVGVGEGLHKTNSINGIGLGQRTIDIEYCQVHLESNSTYGMETPPNG
jgi:hypothetical protein